MACITVRGDYTDMRIISISMETENQTTVPMCACIGYFDGMHVGHQALIRRTIELAEKHGCESALITFDPDPWVTVRGIQNVKHITTLRQRINMAVSFGIQNVIKLKFSKEMSMLEPSEFTSRILGHLRLRAIVCGFDFRYGKNGAGSAETLRQALTCETSVIEAVSDSQGKISSTRIEQALVKGDIRAVNRMLGYRYQLEGTVMHGRHKGTGLGFPTANLSYAQEYLLPKSGVYAGYVTFDSKTYPAMINIGHNPTLNFQDALSVEAHILNYKGDLYGKRITISFSEYIREEKDFRNRTNLIMQLEQDTRNVQRVLKNDEF